MPACRPSASAIAENGSVVELSSAGVRIVDQVEAGITFVDGLAVGDVRDASLRDRRHLAEDGVLIVVVDDRHAERPARSRRPR